jgi:predicted glycogen debranching enzyme
MTFTLQVDAPQPGQAFLRTDLGRARIRRREIIEEVEQDRPILHRDWHDVAMLKLDKGRYELRLPLLEVGTFHVKAFFLPKGGAQPLWPPGENVRVKVEPAINVAANTLYSTFVRQFRFPSKDIERHADRVGKLERDGYTVIPPSGKFRELIGHLDFIVGTLGARILQLLPIHPTPTTYAKMGQFGSPFAALDFMDVDPSLAEFDRRTTPLEQFGELIDAVHRRHARLFLDIPVDHTGWASWLQLHHHDWFVRLPDRTFQSPGAWGVTWGDLSKLDYDKTQLWSYIADVFLYWCRHGVDGFRCDAGYMVPQPAWEYITAKVRDEFPNTTFLLEGLGGPPEVTEALVGEAGLNWAYSELFQNYTLDEVDHYLPKAIRATDEAGLHVHFAETHDNDRLAATSQEFAMLRTALCALCSQEGGFGITNGVEWFASKKIRVHEAQTLNWGAAANQVKLVARLNTILERHPAFHPGAELRLIHLTRDEALALLRLSPEGKRLLILANLDTSTPRAVEWPRTDFNVGEATDLLSGRSVCCQAAQMGFELTLEPAQVLCLSPDAGELQTLKPSEEQSFGPIDRCVTQRLRAISLEAWSCHAADPAALPENTDLLVDRFRKAPETFCAEIAKRRLAQLTRWTYPQDLRRIVMIPPGHSLLITAADHFRVAVTSEDRTLASKEALPDGDSGWFVWLPPLPTPASRRKVELSIRVHCEQQTQVGASSLLLLPAAQSTEVRTAISGREAVESGSYAILTNQRGAMAQVRCGWGEVESLYDAMLAGNLDPACPVDRWVMLTRCRAWVVWRGYSQKLDRSCLKHFAATPDGPVQWNFDLPCGMGKHVRLTLCLRLDSERNAIRLGIERSAGERGQSDLDDGEAVRLDRVNHGSTKAFTGPEERWPVAVRPDPDGFEFSPAAGRVLRIRLKGGTYTHEPEWTYSVEHGFEKERGLECLSDHFSPGYLSIELSGGESAVLTAKIDSAQKAQAFDEELGARMDSSQVRPLEPPESRPLQEALREAMNAFVVHREGLKTVIAGYPWFLDWGRDTLICLRGLIAAGFTDEALAIVRQFALFESGGTLPNMIVGADTSNRSTTDAPLWFAVACGELLHNEGDGVLEAECGGRTLAEVLLSIGRFYASETESGASMDAESALIWSPTHHTWMDTNHPAGTPREGYPIEIQALWCKALELLSRLEPDGMWPELAQRVKCSIKKYFALPGQPFLSDCLHGPCGTPASLAIADDACRPNQLFALTLGALDDFALCRSVLRECRSLLVPGAIRSLADKPVRHPLAIRREGELLNDPHRPYWGHYLGAENTRRKPAYHNGTAWVWPMPVFCESMVRVYGDEARKEALALLESTSLLLEQGALGHAPEILDGDAPHAQRGCGAQAWSVTEIFRVLTLLTTT